DVFVHYGPSRSAHHYLQIDELVLDLMKPNNYITIEVVGHNINNYYFADETPLFAVELYSNQVLIQTTDNFSCFLLDDRIRKVQRYSYQRNFAESYKQNKDRQNFYLGDCQMFPKLLCTDVEAPILLQRQTPYPIFDVIDQIFVVEMGTFALDDTLPIWHDRAIDLITQTYKGYSKETLEVALSDNVSRFVYKKSSLLQTKDINKNQYHIYDTLRTLTGFIRLDIEVFEPTIFYVIFDEVDFKESKDKNTNGIFIDFKRNDCSNIIRYELEPGIYHLQSFEPYSVRYINLAVSSGHMEVHTLNVVTFENNQIYKLNVETDDNDIDLIIKASQNTLAQNAVDVLTDCPSRERAGWLCDSWFSARAEQLMTGDNQIERNFLMNYAKSPQSPYLPKGMIPMNYPADHTDGIYIPNWSLWYGVELYDYFLRTSDTKLIEESRTKVEGIIEYFKAYENEYGLLENLDSWVFIEWSEANSFVKGVNIPSNMMYAHFIDSIGKLYHQEDLLLKAKVLKQTIKKMSFNGTFFEDQLLRDENNQLKQTHNTSETCQYYAFFTNTATVETFSELYNVLLIHFGYRRNEKNLYPHVYKSNAFIGNYLRLEILRKNKAYEQLLSECKDYFLYMARRTQTLWEHRFVYGSLNHGFASYTANLLIEALTGIKGYNPKTKEIYMTQIDTNINYKMYIPYAEGLFITKNDEDFQLKLPIGYTVVEC
ncbi:MAG: hypothetical protein WCR19_05235, partial [Acholeplasmataceae bacterium]